MVRDHSAASQAGFVVVWAPCWTRWPGWTCSTLKWCCGLQWEEVWDLVEWESSYSARFSPGNCSSLIIIILCLSPQKLQVVLDKCLNLHQRTTSGTAWKDSVLNRGVQLQLVLPPNLIFCNHRFPNVLCIVFFKPPEQVLQPPRGCTETNRRDYQFVSRQASKHSFSEGWKGHCGVTARCSGLWWLWEALQCTKATSLS